MNIELTKEALKDLKKIDIKQRKIILEKIELLKDYPATPNIKNLQTIIHLIVLELVIIECYLI